MSGGSAPRTRAPSVMAAAGGAPRNAPPSACCRLTAAPLRPPSLLPEELPRVALEVPRQLLEVVVDLRLHQQRARRALALAHVGDERLQLAGEPVDLVADAHEV